MRGNFKVANYEINIRISYYMVRNEFKAKSCYLITWSSLLAEKIKITAQNQQITFRINGDWKRYLATTSFRLCFVYFESWWNETVSFNWFASNESCDFKEFFCNEKKNVISLCLFWWMNLFGINTNSLMCEFHFAKWFSEHSNVKGSIAIE